MNDKPKKSRLPLIIGIIVVIIAAIIALTGFITDIIWFNDVGYTSVFLTEIFTKIKIAVPSFVILSFISIFMLNVLKRNFLKKNNFTLTEPRDKKNVKRITIVLSLILAAFVTAIVVSSMWFEILEFFNSTEFGVSDPLFNKDISFYLFKYDFLSGMANCAIVIILALLIVTVLYHSLLVGIAEPGSAPFKVNRESGDEEQEAPQFDPNDPLGSIFRGINNKVSINIDSQKSQTFKEKAKAVLGVALKEVVILGVLLLLTLAAKLYLDQYKILYSATGVAYGAGFTDVNVTLNIYRVLIVLALISAVMLIVASKKKSLRLAIIAPALMVIISVVGTLASGLVQNLIVEPNELTKESKYIENNIKYTRLAYDLADIKIAEFSPQNDLTIEKVLDNMETLSNIRINDFSPTEQFYNSAQSIRSYYNFNDVDVDRYYVNGEYTQVFLSAREIDSSRIEDSWLIRHLKYTHGYGLTLSRVDRVTSSGQPDMLIQSIPPVSEVPEIKITRPEIYYGELCTNYIITNTKETEFDYPSGESNVYCNYEGEGGIKLGFVNRLLFSIREQSLKMLIATNINSNSRIHIYRNIMDRVKKIAPFLTYDNDPYVVTVDGGIYWIVDAYTESSKYPYSEPYDQYGTNYLRNSVKIIINAYNGDVNFYLCDESDPIVQTLAKIYPALLKTMDQMPEAFKAHLQYPNALFNIQSKVYAKYHMTDTGSFYQSEDLWAVAKDIFGQSEATMTANYFIMKLPGEDKAEFVSNVAYTPNGKQNLTGILTARSDGANYGQIILYRMPKDRMVYGPSQIEAQVNQDAEISKEFALWNNSGSTYSRGDMFVIPVGDALLYVEPVYMVAATSGLPEVKRVIVYYNDRLAYASTLAEALDELFGKGAGDPLLTKYPIITGHEMAEAIRKKSEEPDHPDDPVTPDDPNPPVIDPTSDLAQLAAMAQQAYESAQTALKNADWTSYGKYMSQLEDILNKMASGTEGE